MVLFSAQRIGNTYAAMQCCFERSDSDSNATLVLVEFHLVERDGDIVVLVIEAPVKGES